MDPESFVRVGPNLTVFLYVFFYIVVMGGEMIHIPLKMAIVGPLAKRHLMAFRWRADDCSTLNAGLAV